MRTLAIDPGMAACGWAVLEAPSDQHDGVLPIAVGVITTPKMPGIDRSIADARRTSIVGGELARIFAAYGCTEIAAEAWLSYGSVHAAIPQLLCWGAVLQLAGDVGVTVRSVVAKDWQHAVAPAAKKTSKKHRYKLVVKAMKGFLAELLEHIEPSLQTHAIDAGGVGIYSILRPSSKRRIARAA